MNLKAVQLQLETKEVKQFSQRAQRLRSVRNVCPDRRKEPKPVFFFNQWHYIFFYTRKINKGNNYYRPCLIEGML